MTLGDFAAPEFTRRGGVLEAALGAALLGPEVEAVHHVRTSWRRVEAAVEVLPWLVRKHSWADFHQRMKAVMRASAELRDRDNAQEMLRPFAALCLAIQGQRRLWEAEFLRRVRALYPFVLPLRKEFPRAATEDCHAAATRIVQRVERKVAGERSKLRVESESDEWHRFRLLSKRQRYTLEFFSELEESWREEIAVVKRRQDMLGAVEDVVAAIRVARAATPAAKLIAEPLEFLRHELQARKQLLEGMP